MRTNINIEEAKKGDCAELLQFLVSVFRRDTPFHPEFDTLYPEIFIDDDAHMGRHAIVRDNGKIVACVGSYNFDLRLPDGSILPCLGIGQVSTAQSHLGKGYMGALLRYQLERGQSEGIAVAWLGGRQDRYARVGFEGVGIHIDYTLTKQSLRNISITNKITRESARNCEITDEMLAIRNTTVESVLLPPSEYKIRLSKIANAEIWKLNTQQGKLLAWALIRPEYSRIEEYSGSPEHRLELTAAIAQEVGTIHRADALLSPMSPLLRPISESIYCGTNSLSIINLDKTIATYKNFLPPSFKMPNFTTTNEATRYLFGPYPGSPCLPFSLPDIFHC